MLPSEIGFMTKHVLSVMLVVVTVMSESGPPRMPLGSSIPLDTPGLAAPLSAQPGSENPRLLAKWEAYMSGSGGTSARTYAPTGAVICLVHEFEFGLADETVSYPDRIVSDAVVGCDTVVAAGSQPVFEFNSANSPEFSEFADRFTNSVDETVWTFVQLVNDDRLWAGAGGGSGRCETLIKAGRRCGKGKTPFFAGYTLDFIRLTVLDFQFNVSDGGHSMEYSASVLWEFYGHR